MPSLAESTNVDTSGYEPIEKPVTSLSGFAPVSNAEPGQSVYMRTPIPPIWHASTDSLRTYFNGGVVPQNRLIPPTPPTNVIQAVTNNHTTQQVTNVTNTNDPTQGFTFGSNANGHWEKDPVGIITQWGYISTDINGGTLAVTFPIPFPTAVEMVLAVTSSPTDRITYVVDGSPTLTGFTVGNNGSSGFAYWEAKGR